MSEFQFLSFHVSFNVSQRRLCVTCRMEFCLRLTTDGAIDHLGENERHLLRTDRDLVPTCKVFVRKCCVVLGFVLYAQEYGTAIF